MWIRNFLFKIFCISIVAFSAHASENQASCPETAQAAQKKLGLNDEDILMCTSEKWPGLAAYEFYVTIVSHDSESNDPTATVTHSLVVNSKTEKEYLAAAPNRFYFFAKDKAYDKITDELLRAAIAAKMTPPNQKFSLQINCGDEKPTPRLSLISAGEAYEWQIDFDNEPHRCQLIQKGENPRFATSDIVISTSRLRLTGGAAMPDLAAFNVVIQPRQTYSDYRSNRDYLRDFVHGANEMCAFPKAPVLAAKKSPIFEANRSPDDMVADKKIGALEINLPGRFGEHYLIKDNSAVPLELYLEEKNELDRPHIVGAWHISSFFEAKNLVYMAHDKNPKRIVLKDSSCGKEYASNWFDE
jgi:hypothetical protein